jgi:outer membrane lipoprotein SlyB
MQAVLLQPKKANRKGLLYPLLVVAAISVIVFSAVGAAALAGWLPRAESALQKQGAAPPPGERAATTEQGGQRQREVQSERLRKDEPTARAKRIAATRASACADCGVVASIKPVEVKGRTNGIGMITGGVAGALLGNQVGRGNGNAIATVGGAAGGAFAGNEVEKNVKKSVRYKVRVQMPDGTFRTAYHDTSPRFDVGDMVRISNGRAVKAG